MTTQASSRSPTLADVIRNAISQALDDVHVMLPGKVEAYDPTTQKADVKPLIQRRIALQDGEELVEVLPVLPNVPVVFPRAGGQAGFYISFPLAPGDHVMLVFSERSLDRFLAGTGADTDPDNFSRHDLSDAVALPGLWPFTKAIPAADANAANLAMGKIGGPQLHFDGVNVHVGGFPGADFLAKATPTEARIAALETAFNAHVHPTGVGPSGPPTPLVTPGSPVTTTIVKGT